MSDLKAEIKIIFENEDYAVLNKPAGLIVHNDGRTKEETLVDWLLKKYPEIGDVGEDQILPDGRILKRSGVVHRLDRDTSGVMVIAKNAEMHRLLKSQFSKHKVGKNYLAFLCGELKKDEGLIDLAIGRSKSNPILWSASRGKTGLLREAITRFQVLERGHGATLIKAEPKTGRTHQIRVHFKAINYPIIGDLLYGRKGCDLLDFKRLALHSFSLVFKDRLGNKMFFEAELPEDFRKALNLAGFKSLC